MEKSLSLQRLLPLSSRVAAALPRSVAESLADACGDAAWRSGGCARARLAANLDQTLGRAAEPAQVRAAFRAYARYFLAFMRLAHLGPERALGPFRWRDDAPLRATQARGRGIAVLSAHLGNWDLVGVALAERFGPVTTFVERLSPPSVYEFYRDVRRRHGVRVLPAGESTREPLAVLGRNEVLAAVADRPFGSRLVQVPFGRGALAVPSGVVTWALRGGAGIHGVFAVREGDEFVLHCTEDLAQPVPEPRAVCAAVADALAATVRGYPDQWCQWHALGAEESAA